MRKQTLGYAKGLRPGPGEMFRYQSIFPFFALSKTFNTRQVAITTTPLLVIETLRPKMHALVNADPVNLIFIGPSDALSVVNGWPILTEERWIFGMGENTRLFAVSSVPTTLYILEMGI